MVNRLQIFIVLFFTLQVINFSYGQNSVTVKLLDKEGYGPFKVIKQVTNPDKPQPNDYQVPQNLKLYRIRSYNFQPFQSLYWKYLKEGTFKMFEYFVQRGLDTTRLTAKIFENKLWILIGKSFDGTTVVIPDYNYDHSFINDEPINFTRANTKEEELRLKANPQKKIISYNYFNGKFVEKRTEEMKFNTYLGNLKFSNSPDTIDNSLFLEMGFSSHKHGVFNLGQSQFKVVVSNGFLDGGYSNTNTSIIFSSLNDDFSKESDGNVPYKIGDTLLLADNLIRIDSLSFSASNLFLTFLSKSNNNFGHLPGDYLPRFEGVTIDNRIIRLGERKGKYLLLDFWGTWCAPCIESIPQLKRIKSRFSNRPLEIIGVAYDYDNLKVQDFVNNRKMDWINIFQPRREYSNRSLISKLKVESFPTVFLIDTNGRIVMRETTLDRIESKLNEIFLGSK